METKILVIYVGVAGLRSEDIPDYVNKVTKKITPTYFEGEIIVLPTQTLKAPDTRIECINPIYITEPELIAQHLEIMKKLHEALQFQLEHLKETNNE